MTNLKKYQKGQGLVEYALIVALVAILCVSSLRLVGQRASDVFDSVFAGSVGAQGRPSPS